MIYECADTDVRCTKGWARALPAIGGATPSFESLVSKCASKGLGLSRVPERSQRGSRCRGAGGEVLEAIMADKLGPLSDGSPRDASKMVSNSHVSLYVGLVLAAIVIGFALYWLSTA